MSALHRLKAYFGMVPADEFDDYGPDYEYYGDEHRHDEYRRDGFRAGYDARHEPVHPGRDRAYGGGRPVARDRADFEDHHHDDHATDVAAPRMSATRRPAWVPTPPGRGSLAVDTAASIREPLHREPLHREPSHREPPHREPVAPPRGGLFLEEEANPLARIVTLHPHNYSEARPIGERYREGIPVIMNLTEMDDKDAKRLVDFAAGLAFALRGSIDKVTNKVFLLSPPNVEVSAEDRRLIAEGGLFNQS